MSVRKVVLFPGRDRESDSCERERLGTPQPWRGDLRTKVQGTQPAGSTQNICTSGAFLEPLKPARHPTKGEL